MSDEFRWSAREIKDRLHRRYGEGKAGVGAGGEGERWICVEEARSGASWAGNNAQCDFLAIESWAARGHEVIGHEVKISMTDWKKELSQPEKAEVFARYCHRWYVVMPHDLAQKVKHEVPPNWGLLAVWESGTIRELQKPVKRKPEPIPQSWFIGWLAQIDRQYKRRLPGMVAEASATKIAAAIEKASSDVEERVRNRTERLVDLDERVRLFAQEVGIDIRHTWPEDIKRIGRVWRVLRAGAQADDVVRQLRSTAEKLEALFQEEPE